MARIRSRGSRAELQVRRMLHASGYRFRVHRTDLPGTPDIALAKHRVAIFLHGCFWHGHHGCIDGHMPESNEGYWAPKLRRNAARDAEVAELLMAAGWRVLMVRECELGEPRLLQSRLSQ